MSNNQNRNNNGNNGNNGAAQNPQNNGEKPQQEKTTFVGRIIKLKDKVMASKVGRIAVRGLKLVGVGGIAYASYRAGAKSVKPTTVYIQAGVDEEEETPETEPVIEETGEAAE